MSLYMIYAVKSDEKERLIKDAAGRIAQIHNPFKLEADRYLLGDDRMFEVKYNPSEDFRMIQRQIVRATNHLRDADRHEKMYAPHTPPGEERTDEWLASQPRHIRENIQNYGYEELAAPLGATGPGGEQGIWEHVTLGKQPEGTAFDIAQLKDEGVLPREGAFDSKAVSIGVFEMGPNGTCVREIAEYPLGQAALRFQGKPTHRANPFANRTGKTLATV
jgi:hypothetical protein